MGYKWEKFVTCLLLGGALHPCAAQRDSSSAQAQTRTDASDATWTKAYATVCDGQPCATANNPQAGLLEIDPRFAPLLKRSLPQPESWWVDGYGGSAAVSSLVATFLGIPKQVSLEKNRYITATGCVPHVCTVTGMLWIDTGVSPATVVFVGEDLVGDADGNSDHHVYLYTSRELATYYAGKRRIGIFAPEFLEQLERWRSDSVSSYDNQHVVLATVVWPNGRTHDQLWSDLMPKAKLSPRTPGAKP